MSKPLQAITLTAVRQPSMATEPITVPVTRIAQASPAGGGHTLVTLRTPLGHLLVRETPEEIAALMNGDGRGDGRRERVLTR